MRSRVSRFSLSYFLLLPFCLFLGVFLGGIVALSPFLAPSAAYAESAEPAEQFLKAYQAFQKGERLEHDGNNKGALEQYQSAQGILTELMMKHPTWQPQVVEYRLHKIKDNLARMGPLSSMNSLEDDTSALNQEDQEETGMQNPVLEKIENDSGDSSRSSSAVSDAPSISIIPPSDSGGRKREFSDKEVLQLRQQLKKVEQQLEEAQRQLAGKDQEIDKGKVLLVDMRSQLQKAQQQVSDLKHDLGDAKNQSSKREAYLNHSIQELQGKVSALEADQEVVLEENTQLQRELKETSQSMTSAIGSKKRFEELEVELSKAENEVVAMKQQLDQAQKERQTVEQKNRDLEAAIKNSQEKIEHSSENKEEVAALEKSLQELKSEGMNKDKLLDQAHQQIKRLQEQEIALQPSQEQRTQLMNIQADKNVLEEERSNLQERLKRAEDELEILRKIGGDASQLRNQSHALERQLEEANQRLEESEQKRKELLKDQGPEAAARQEKLDEALNHLKKLEEEKEALSDQAAKQQGQLAQLTAAGNNPEAIKAQITHYQAELQTEKIRLIEANKKIEMLQKAQPQKDQLLAEKEKELSQLREGSQKLEQDLQKAHQELSGLQEQLQQKEDRYQELKKSFDQQSASLRRLQQQEKEGKKDAETDSQLHENQLLKGIVLKELQEEAKRQQLKKLIVEDLDKLKVNSSTLSNELEQLAHPVPLTSEEQALFKGALPAPPAEEENEEASKNDAEQHSDNPDQSGEAKKEEGLTLSFSAQKESKEDKSNSEKEKKKENENKTEDESASPTPSPGASPEASPDDSTPPQDPEKLRELIAQAKEEFGKQDYTQAERSFQDALKIQPESYVINANLGVVEFQLGKLSEAEKCLKKASALNPKKPFALTTLGIVYYRQQKLQEADKVLRDSLALNDKDAMAHNYLGIVLAAEGKSKAGESEIMKSIELNPDYADAHFNLAVIYATAKPPTKTMARKEYDRALSMGAPADPSLDKLLGEESASSASKGAYQGSPSDSSSK